MSEYSLAHLDDADLTRNIAALVTRDRVGMAVLLAHLAEFDARRLFRSAGYPSMFAYCVGELHFSDDEAGRRIRAARAARRFPALYRALAASRLHLTAICFLSPHLTEENADDLIEAATHRSRNEVQALLAQRFPESLPQVEAKAIIRRVVLLSPKTSAHATSPPVTTTPAPAILPAPTSSEPSAPISAKASTPASSMPLFAVSEEQLTQSESIIDDTSAQAGVPIRHKEHVPERVKIQNGLSVSSSSVLDTGCFLIRLTVARTTHDKLREAQALLSHVVAPGDVADVLDRALDVLLMHLRRRRIGSSKQSDQPTTRRGRPRGGRPHHPSRYIPASVRRAIWERDGGQCTFISDEGRRCAERGMLEFDHVTPLALGGKATPANLRLRCRAHNQHEAERAFGAAFMERKRREARLDDARARSEPEPG